MAKKVKPTFPSEFAPSEDESKQGITAHGKCQVARLEGEDSSLVVVPGARAAVILGRKGRKHAPEDNGQAKPKKKGEK